MYLYTHTFNRVHEILLKVALNTINNQPTKNQQFREKHTLYSLSQSGENLDPKIFRVWVWQNIPS